MKKTTILLFSLCLIGMWAFNNTDRVKAAFNVTRVSLTHDGQQANDDVMWPDMSDDGRYAVFASAASNLLLDDLPGSTFYIFLRDLETGDLSLVSKSMSGAPANDSSYYPVISGDGRYVAFSSSASNLIASDTNGMTDIFVYDRLDDNIVRISEAAGDIEANGHSSEPAISDDGAIVVYQSLASNLITGDTNNVYDVFAYVMASGITTRVSVDNAGHQVAKQSVDPDISGNGRYVVFNSYADLTYVGNTASAIYAYDRTDGTITRISAKVSFYANDYTFDPYISDDGRYAIYDSKDHLLVENDTNNNYDVFVYDRNQDTTRRVSVDSNGNQANGMSLALGISGDGRYVLFESDASDLVPDDANNLKDIFVHDLLLGTTQRVNLNADGIEGNYGASGPATLSDNGNFVIYQSASTNLVPNDTNNNIDIFVNEGGSTLAPITLVVTKITDNSVGLDATDPADFYVKVWIAPADPGDLPTFNNVADHTVDEATIRPFWAFSRSVEPFSNRTVIFEVWDYDDGAPDELADINPTPGEQRITLSIDADTGQWGGDVSWPQNCIGGDEAASVEICWDISVISESGDLDGDGLLDGWETNGLNHTGNQVIDVDLPTLGADPAHKDIFVEIDYMVDPAPDGVSYRPHPEAIQTIVESFANAPVTNPDGTTGIHLHVDYGADAPLTWGAAATWGAISEADAIPHQVHFGTCTTDTSGDLLYEWDAVDALKPAYFNSGRAFAFHYNPWVDNLCAQMPTVLGISRGIEASDFVVTSGDWLDKHSQAGLFMHELGHNLGLRHGGGDDINHKPHYLSVMNYNYATLGLFVGNNFFNYDYSRYTFPTLDEQHLDETAGVSPPANAPNLFGIIYACPSRNGFQLLHENQTAVDWDCDGNSTETGLAADINGDGSISTLSTQTDWDKLVYTGGVIGALSGSTPPTATPMNDIREEDLISIPGSTTYLPMIVRP